MFSLKTLGNLILSLIISLNDWMKKFNMQLSYGELLISACCGTAFQFRSCQGSLSYPVENETK